MTGSEALHRLPPSAKINLAAVAILAALLAVHLWPEWARDPDLSHGLLAPAACALLIHLSRPVVRDTLGPGASALLCAAFGVAALAALWAAGLFAATLDWTSPLVDFTLACAFALLGCAAIAAFADRRLALVPFNWTSLAAALLWPLCAPPPPGTYSRLSLGLQLWVTGAVMRTLDILGIAARREGNLIELARGTVGIEEACSGVRSLVSCVFAGILFSAALTRRPAARVLVVVLSAPLAIAMNFLRSLLLTLLVNAGVRVSGGWHDVTGYAVLVVTALILIWIALALDRGHRGGAEAPPEPGAGAPGRAPQAALSCVVGLCAATLAFFGLETGPGPAPRAAPDLAAMFPASVPGWQVAAPADLYQFTGTLRTNHLVERTYERVDGAGPELVTLYVAYWSPGQASVGLVGSHTPDACAPGTGWVAGEVPDPRVALEVAGRTLPPAQHRMFSRDGYAQNVWFWQLYDRRTVEVGDPRSIPGLLRTALRFGFRRGGEQSFVRISSNRAWGEVSREPFVADFLARAEPLGLD